MFKYYAKASGLGKTSYLLRAPAAFWGAVLIVVHHLEKSLPFEWTDYFALSLLLLAPQYYLYRYVKSGNNKKVALRQVNFDIFISGVTMAALDLSVVPAAMFGLSILTTYIAVRGVNKFYRVIAMPIGILFVLVFQDFHYDFTSSDLMKFLSIGYEVVHASVLSYASYMYAREQYEGKIIIERQSKEITAKNLEIFNQSQELKALNESLHSWNKTLEKRVEERTREIAKKNEKLAEYAFLNAHKLSEPLSTIVGLVRLLEEKRYTAKQRDEILQKLHDAAAQLNQILKEIMDKLLQDELIEKRINQ